MSLVVGLDHSRRPPAEIELAVREWARKKGKTTRFRFVPEMGCWTINLSLRPDDPMLAAWRSGKLKQAEEPTEGVILQEWDAQRGRYVPLNLDEWGASGIVELLERGDLTSGRGEFNSLQEAVAHQTRLRAETKEKTERMVRESARMKAREVRRVINDTPYHTVGINLSPNTPTKES